MSDETWRLFCSDLTRLERSIARSNTVNVNVAELRDQAADLARLYFRQTRTPLHISGVDIDLIRSLDGSIRKLLTLSMKPNAKATYLALFKEVDQIVESITVDREVVYSENALLQQQTDSEVLTEHELLMVESLAQLVPSAARSYRQAAIDLADKQRVSYRGAANELREALREVLDYLAPDEEVVAQDGFTLEKGQTKPTRKQKARYVLKAREMSEAARKAPEGAIDTVEAKVAVVVSATYSRTNLATHIQTELKEVQMIKRYVDLVLSELLSVPQD